MFDIPLLKACVQQQQILEELVKPPRIVLDRDSLAEAVQFFAVYSEQLDRTQRCLLFRAGKVNHPETPAIGECVSSLIQAALARGYLLKQAVGLAGRINHVPVPSESPNSTDHELNGPAVKVDRAEDLDRAIQRLERLRDVHARDWPREVLPARDEVLAAQKSGQSQPLAEAFAEVSGLDAAEWGKRVEEYRTKTQQTRGG